MPTKELPDGLTKHELNLNNNIMLMTDGYKFSHHRQFPVSWLPAAARPSALKQGAEYKPPLLFPGLGGVKGSTLLKVQPVPGCPEGKLCLVTSASSAVVAIEPSTEAADVTFAGTPVSYAGELKKTLVLEVSEEIKTALGLTATKVSFANVDENKFKRGSSLNPEMEGGYNVSYFTCRAYKDNFEPLAADGKGDHIVFFGLQYFIKEYLTGKVIDTKRIDEADAFVSRYMADVRYAMDDFYKGYDYTMFPRGDWEAMVTGDYDAVGTPAEGSAPGCLPIKIEALPEGSLVQPGVCCFKLTNTHPRFFWLPNFLETLLVQVWYPTSVATQAREFRRTIQAYSILSNRVSQLPAILGPQEFTKENCVADGLAVHIAQVFDLLDFGYRGVSSHETAMLGSAAYYTTGFEGSDTVAGSRMLLHHYNAKDAPSGLDYTMIFQNLHGATSIPAAEHSTITSWADMSPESDPDKYELAEYAAFSNMIKQYMPAFGVSLVSDGFNIWNAVANHWCSDDTSHGGPSMKAMLKERLAAGQLSLIRPDSGEGVETLPQLLTLVSKVLPEMWQAELPALTNPFGESDPRAARYLAVVNKINKKLGKAEGSNPFRCFIGQQFRILQGDGVALDTVGDMCASLLCNGFCVNTVHFGSGGGLLQKLNRDSLSCAFKCCAMYVGSEMYTIGKDPIAGGKKSYPGNPAVVRDKDGVLRNRGEYDADGKMVCSHPMTVKEFKEGVQGDELKLVLNNGVLSNDNAFMGVRGRAKVMDLDNALSRALDNLEAKVDFLQKLSSDEAMAVRLAEASCGSKWMTKHPTKLDKMLTRFPEYAEVCTKLGLEASMDSNAMIAHIKDKCVLDKKSAKKVLAAIADGELEDAAAKFTKPCITL